MDSAQLAADTATVIAENGQPVTLTRTTGGTYDPATGNITGSTTASYNTHGVQTGYSAFERASSLIQETDVKVLLTAEQAPQIGDVMALTSATGRIISIDTVAPDGIAILHKCQVRL